MKPAEILVIGATGLTGGAVLRNLTTSGVKVRALVRDLEKASALKSDLVELVVGNLDDAVSLDAALVGIRSAYLNIMPSAETPAQVDTFLEAARKAGVQHVAKLSVMNASPDSRSELLRIHAEADQRVVNSGLGYTLVRANSFYQNILSQMDAIKATGQFYQPLGDTRFSLVDVADIAAVAAKVMIEGGAQGRSIDISGPESITYHDVASSLSNALGIEVAYIPISSDAFKGSLLGFGMSEEVAIAVAELFSVFNEGGQADVSLDFANIMGRPARTMQAFADDLSG